MYKSERHFGLDNRDTVPMVDMRPAPLRDQRKPFTLARAFVWALVITGLAMLAVSVLR